MNRFRTRFLAALLLVMALLAPACTPISPVGVTQPVTLTVFAASSLSQSFQKLGQQFEASHPQVKVVFSFAGSQQLALQLANAAPADVFASANQKTMDAAVQSKRVDASAVQVFARNRLIVIFPAANPANITRLQDLARPKLKLVLAAKEVPAGQYSLDFLDKAAQDPAFSPDFKQAVLKNVVSYEETVKAVLTKISVGEADAGIVYTTDVFGSAAEAVQQIAIPDPLNVIATYPIAAISDSPHHDLAAAFVDLVLSPEGQALLKDYGFIGR